MKQNIYFSIAIFFTCLFAGDIVAQEVKISAELRPRYEMRHGYMTLVPDDVKAANFVSQRTRLNAFYANSNFKVYLSIQDVRVWGDVPQLNKSDVYGPSIHEAWGEAILSEKFSIKVGRQEIVYDDQRMFGSVGWAQQARSHDAAIFKIKASDNHKVDVGLAYNANGESLFKQDYTVNSYKTFQYAWYHGDFNKFGLSFLALNNGMPYIDSTEEQKVSFSQTIGPRLTFTGDALSANAAFYYQGGKDKSHNELSAIYFTIAADFNITSKFSIGAGVEYLSGTDTNEEGGKNKSFTPFYGTNHKFNGWMDYFYVGAHNDNVGLTDIFVPFKFKSGKFSAAIIPHVFLSAAEVSGFDKYLGIENDLVFGYAPSKELILQCGYSTLVATETMGVIKNTSDYDNLNSWAWVMITFKPTFFEKKQ